MQQKLTFRSGINTQVSPTANEGGWSNGNLVRFRDGFPEVWSGWEPAIGTALQGVCRNALAWMQLDGNFNVGFATTSALELLQGGLLYDITPTGLTTGTTTGTTTVGWGSGAWSDGTWGTARAGIGGTTNVGTPITTLSARVWSLATFGEDLLATPNGGPLYVWAPSGGTSAHALQVVNAGTAAYGPPLRIGSMLMGMPERHVILLGCSALNATTTWDPMLVRFSDVEDFTNYYATATNSAGSFRLEGGTRLVGGLGTPGQILIWSDLCLFSMRFIGGLLVYGFNTLGSNCGLIGPNACCYYGGVVYWISKGNFFRYVGGAPEPLPCAIYKHVFGNIDDTQGDKAWAGVSAAGDSVLFAYQSANGTDVDSYAEFHPSTGDWSFGLWDRTAWCPTPANSPPVAVGYDGTIYHHEIGHNSITMSGGVRVTAPLPAFVESGYIDIGDGTDFMAITQVIPDFAEQIGNVYMTIFATEYPNAIPRAYGPFVLSPSTRFAKPRARGRQIKFRFEIRDLGSYFRLSNALRINAIVDGRR